MANSLMSIRMIEREAIEIFKNSNKFIDHIMSQYEEEFAVSEISLSTKEVAVLGVAAIIAKNPVISRRSIFAWT